MCKQSVGNQNGRADGPTLRSDGLRSGLSAVVARTVCGPDCPRWWRGRSAVRTVRGGGADGPRVRRVS
jgi:hypothetical protein